MRVYAYDEKGNKYLIKITCDMCEKEIKPYPKISESGWMKEGWNNGIGSESFVKYYCPDCWNNRYYS